MRSLILALITVAAGSIALADDPVRQRLDRTVDFLEARVKSDPDDFTAINRFCDALLRRSRWTGHLDDWRRAAKLSARSLTAVPEDLNPSGLSVSGQAAMAGHQFAEARDFAKRLAIIAPGRPLSAQILGDASLELGDLDGAAKAFDQLVKSRIQVSARNRA